LKKAEFVSFAPLKKEKPVTQILFVTPERTHLDTLAAVATNQSARIVWATSGSQALEAVGKQPVDLVVADESVGDMSALELAQRLVSSNPMINCAVVSTLSDKAYHEASEGLGILMKLPPNPGEADGRRLLDHLSKVLGLSTGA
jgi:CheY-like chemotaxis protein